MAIRSAAISAFALAAALVFAQPGRAQGFFNFFEMSPRQIVGMLEDNGYQLRGPLLRRGDVYVCDVVSVSGRSARLIVDARDGHIMEHFAVRAPQWRRPDEQDAPHVLTPPRDVGGDDRDADSQDDWNSHRQTALGDIFTPPSRVYGGGGDQSWTRPAPEDTLAAKPKHHATRKHKEPSLAKSHPSAPAPQPTSSVAAVAPSAAPESKKPDVDTVKPEVKPEATPPAAAASPEPAQKNADADKSAVAKPVSAAKPPPQRKKINDLPIGTLD